MADFKECYLYTAGPNGEEGGYVNRKDDRGGETHRGLQKHEYVKYGFTGPIWEAPEELIQMIYKKEYWEPIKGDLIKNPIFAKIIFDTGVLQGVGTAGKLVQDVLLNTFKLPLKVDGIIGAGTVSALNSIPDTSTRKFLFDFIAAKVARFRETIKNDTVGDQTNNIVGWEKRAYKYLLLYPKWQE